MDLVSGGIQIPMLQKWAAEPEERDFFWARYYYEICLILHKTN